MLWDDPYVLARPLADAKADDAFDADDVVYAILFSLYGNFFVPREEHAVLRIMEVRRRPPTPPWRGGTLTPPPTGAWSMAAAHSTCSRPTSSGANRPRPGCATTRSSRACSWSTPSALPPRAVQQHEAGRAHRQERAGGLRIPMPRNFANGRMYLKAALQDPVLAVLEDDLLNLEIDPVKVNRSRRCGGGSGACDAQIAPRSQRGAPIPQIFQGLSPKERLMMGLGDVLTPSDGRDLANHPAMKERLSQGAVRDARPRIDASELLITPLSPAPTAPRCRAGPQCTQSSSRSAGSSSRA